MRESWAYRYLFAATATFLLLVGCDDFDGSKERARDAERAWNAPCADESVLLATTAGSPSNHKCPNKRHVMRVQIASAPSNEEFGAVVFCECARSDAGVAP